MKIIAAHKYVSPKSRPLNAEEEEVRRISYALKVPTAEAMETAAKHLAPLVDATEAEGTSIVLMPIPNSTGSVDANKQFCNELAAEIHRQYPSRRVQVKVTVGRKHPVESSCVRRKRGAGGLRGEEHEMIRVCKPLSIHDKAYFFVDNMMAFGNTIEAAQAALGFGDAIVFSDMQRDNK